MNDSDPTPRGAAEPRESQVPRPDGRPIRVISYPGRSAGIVIYLHGGAWIMGAPDDTPDRLRALAQEGPTVISIGYTLVSEAPFPAQRDDIEAVVDAMVPPGQPFALMGASAGAHLAALSSLTMRRRPAAFVGLFGRYDLTEAAAHITPEPGASVPAWILASSPPAGYAHLTHRGRLALLAGVDEEALTEDHLAQLSPITALSADSPPILILHGTADGVVAHGHAERLVDAARDVGVDARLMLLPGANHEDDVFATGEIVGAIVAFIDEHLNSDKREEENHE